MNSDQARNQQRILAFVTKDPASGCWLWRHQISNSGYGRIMLRGPDGTYMESAHRASYSAFIERLADGALVRQSCGNRLCVNPEHLELVADKTGTP